MTIRGHATITVTTAIAIGTAVIGGLSSYYAGQSAIAQTVQQQNNAILSTNDKLYLLCNSYLTAISRIDQNTQNIAAALRVNTVKGEYDNGICNK